MDHSTYESDPEDIVSNVNAINATTTSTPTPSLTSVHASLTQDDFLKLLVAELKNQSPDKPADTAAMMSQEAQFSQLSAMQSMEAEQKLLLTSVQSAQAAGLIGQHITAINPAGGNDVSGVVTSVKLGTDGPTLLLGNTEVPLSSVKEVTKA